MKLIFKLLIAWVRDFVNPRTHRATVGSLVFMGRAAVRDVNFQFRMPAGFAGDVNRTHPCNIEPALIDVNAPPLLYGQPVIGDATTQGVRPFVAGDVTTPVVAWGATVRPNPQQSNPSASFGAPSSIGGEIPPTSGVIDILKSGYIMAKVVGSPVKFGQVYVWIAVASGAHVQGGLEAAAGTPGTNTALLTGWFFNGGADTNGIAEIVVNN